MVSPPKRENVLDLLAEILRDGPNLRGARCADSPRLFDTDQRAADLGLADEDQRWHVVQRICATCPVRSACWAWASSVPVSRRPSGPTAASVANPFPRAHERTAQMERDERQRQNDAATTMARVS